MRLDHAALADLCERNDIERLRLFGSYARGDESEDSDVDLIAYFSQRKSLLDLVRIEREFSQRLGRKVDLLTEAAISPYLRDRILGESTLVYTANRDVPSLKAELKKLGEAATGPNGP